MKFSPALLIPIALLVACGKKSPPTDSKPASSGNPVTAPVDYIGAVGKAKSKMEGTLGSAGLSQAIQQFNTAEGRFPKDLNELISKGYVGALPKPPYGMKFRYDAATGEVSLVPAQ